MTANRGQPGRVPGLMDRRAERDALGGLVDAVRSGQSRALVVRGDPGVGKTVLVDHIAPVGLPRTGVPARGPKTGRCRSPTWSAVRPATPAARPGMTHRDERNVR
jgi:predicted NACHT family NTPase